MSSYPQVSEYFRKVFQAVHMNLYYNKTLSDTISDQAWLCSLFYEVHYAHHVQ